MNYGAYVYHKEGTCHPGETSGSTVLFFTAFAQKLRSIAQNTTVDQTLDTQTMLVSEINCLFSSFLGICGRKSMTVSITHQETNTYCVNNRVPMEPKLLCGMFPPPNYVPLSKWQQ